MSRGQFVVISLFVPVNGLLGADHEAAAMPSPMASRTAESVPPKNTWTTSATRADRPRIRPYSTTPWPRAKDTARRPSGRFAGRHIDADPELAAAARQLGRDPHRRGSLLDLPPGVGREGDDRRVAGDLRRRLGRVAAILHHRGQGRREVLAVGWP